MKKELWHRIGDFVWASGSEREELCGSCKKFSGREGRTDRGMRPLRACGSMELGSGNATEDLGWETEK